MSSDQFHFTTCQIGAEKALKAEFAREHPSLKPAFARPGFVTFKGQGDMTSVFARASGLSFGKAASEDELAEILPKILENLAVPLGKKTRLHVWERDRFTVGEEPPTYTRDARVKKIRARLLKLLAVEKESEPEVGDTVLDVIDVDENLWWIGTHTHAVDRSVYPGGVPSITLPENAPSRAYLKLREALLWSRVPMQKGDLAVELGSAPGGASYALLEDGLRVIGIDPGDMDPKIISHPQFRHLQIGALSVQAKQVQDAQWFLMDVNIEPKQAIPWAEMITKQIGDSLLGVILTIKLNQWSLAEKIPNYLDAVRAVGMTKVRARQLAFNKQEICVYGLTRKGAARLR